MGSVGLAGRLGQAVLDLVFPAHCICCERSGVLLCDECIDALPAARMSRCPRCWRPVSNAEPCLECQAAPPPYDGLRAAFVHEGAVREMVRALKYGGTTALAEPMAALLAKAAHQYELAADLIVPVPLSGLRRRTRGYNQAEVLAHALGRELGLPVRPGALERQRHTPPQARSAGIAERRRNVAGAFRSRDTAIRGARVLLLDDVTTTGATLAACADALKEAGAGSVWCLAFARED